MSNPNFRIKDYNASIYREDKIILEQLGTNNPNKNLPKPNLADQPIANHKNLVFRGKNL